MAQERPGQTLQGTALVHEAWIKLASSENQQWQGRAHFFHAAAEAMRRILIDQARGRQRVRHGGEWRRVEFGHLDMAEDADPDVLLAVDEALAELASEDPVKAEIVKLRFFVGMTVEEAGRALDLSKRTTHRYWNYARAWLFDRLRRQYAPEER
jgi:RNA polymerase sigma factor (TIGR02999 family)